MPVSPSKRSPTPLFTTPPSENTTEKQTVDVTASTSIRHVKYHLVSLTGACVEYGWAAGEAVIIPHLLNPPILLSPTVASLIFLVNPVFGICLQPLVGDASDRCESKYCGKRKPFIFLFASIAVAGLIILVLNPTWSLSRKNQIIICFVAFGCMDMAHDILLIPGRSMLLDMVLSILPSKDHVENVEVEERKKNVELEKDLESQADNMYTLYQLIGRFLALVIGSFNLNIKGYFNHYQSLLLSSAIFLIFACGTALTFGVDSNTNTKTKIIYDDGANNDKNDDTNSTYHFLGDDKTLFEANTDESSENNSEEMKIALLSHDHFLNNVYNHNHPLNENINHTAGKSKYSIFPLILLLLVQFLGWVLLCNACFWWTAWIGIDTVFETTGLRTALVTFAIQTFSGLIYTVYGYHFFTRIFGIKKIWLLCEVSYCILMIAFWLVGPNQPILLCLLMFLTGAMFSVHNTAIYSLIRDVVGHDQVAWATALCNNTLPAAQIYVSLSSGYFIGDCLITSPQCLAVGNLFVWSGSVCLALNLIVVFIDSIFKVLPDV